MVRWSRDKFALSVVTLVHSPSPYCQNKVIPKLGAVHAAILYVMLLYVTCYSF